ncbi:MAG: elongation factor P [Nitrospinota bacterium]
MSNIASIRTGMKLEIDGELFEVASFQHVNPGKGQAFVRAKVKNLKTGQLLEKTFKQGDNLVTPDTEEKEMQYLYHDDQGYHFMDNESYDQTFLPDDRIGDMAKFMQENTNVEFLYHKGEVIDVQLPNFVELEVAETEPGFKGDTSSGGTKPATLETGAVLQVPLFIKIGERLKIDTRTGKYIERAK